MTTDRLVRTAAEVRAEALGAEVGDRWGRFDAKADELAKVDAFALRLAGAEVGLEVMGKTAAGLRWEEAPLPASAWAEFRAEFRDPAARLTLDRDFARGFCKAVEAVRYSWSGGGKRRGK